jgi:hypothetical protein
MEQTEELTPSRSRKQMRHSADRGYRRHQQCRPRPIDKLASVIDRGRNLGKVSAEAE